MYDLKPFKQTPQANKINIFAEAFKEQSELLVNFIIEDKNGFMLANDYTREPARKRDLWKTTCFEAFFGIKKSPAYWEFNMNLAGDWNLYYFESYRSSIEPVEESRVREISFEKTIEDDIWNVQVKIPTQNLGLQGKSLDVNLTSVIEFKNKDKSYFALQHGTEKPDFHQRDLFICSLV